MSQDENDQHDPKHCLEMFKKLSEYIDGELDQVTCKELERHVEECVSCKICLATLKKTVMICNEMESNPVPEDVSQRLKEMIQNLPHDRPRFQKG
jgi:anti-sigma factor RsiW